MKTRCPKCDTRYNIAPEALLEADGLARCFRCGTVFDTVPEDSATPDVIHTTPVHTAVELDEQSELPAASDARDRPTAHRSSWLLADPPEPGFVPEQEAHHDASTPAPAAATEMPVAASVLLEESEPPAPPLMPDAEPPQHGAQTEPKAAPESYTVRLVPDQQPQQDALEPDQLPFAIPDDLEPLQPSPDVALDVVDTLYEKRSPRGFYYGLLVTLLVTGLGLQLAWQHRTDLLDRYPILQPLCERIACRPKVIRAPEQISILHRDIKPTTNEPGSLTLSAKIRSDADIAQPLPDIQLSLLDNNGAVLVRRRLTPADYLFPAPPNEKLMAPGEVVTIALDFKDPGYLASGFVIDFL